MNTESIPADPVPGLLEALGHPFVDVRLEAIGAIGRLGPLATDAIPALIRLLDDPDGLLRRTRPRVPSVSAARTPSRPCAPIYLTRIATSAVRRPGRWGDWVKPRAPPSPNWDKPCETPTRAPPPEPPKR
jgi:hypothetical protein